MTSLPKIVIVISGRSRSGKTFVANEILARPMSRMVPFAGLLKEALFQEFPLSYSDDWKSKSVSASPSQIKRCFGYFCNKALGYNDFATPNFVPTWVKTGRHVLQYFGTEICRDIISPLVHIEYVVDSVFEDKTNSIFVMDDLRFEDELELSRLHFNEKNNCQFFHIHKLGGETGDNHSSEKSIDALGERADFICERDKHIPIVKEILNQAKK